MRVLVLLRGAPGCGKSYFIRENNLEQYSLSADNIRIMCQTPLLRPNGTLGISQNNDKKVWEILFDLLEQRLSMGEFTIIDATNSKTIEMNRYRDLAETYRFRLICVDFTDIPIDICKQRNRDRESYKFVPEDRIDLIYERFSTQKIPSGIKTIKPSEFNETIKFKTIDYSHYNKIHHIGDIHACNTVLQEYFKDGLHEDELYIFLGDYIDRGIENFETMQFLLSIYNQPNVRMLEGNHERWLWSWANDMPSKSKTFEITTKIEFDKNKLDKKAVRDFYRKLHQLAYYTYNDKTIIVTHGGISTLPDNLIYIATEQYIKGVGEYKDMELCNETFLLNTPDNTYQIHGHRNIPNVPIQVNDKCFNLEGSVEFGGQLRVVTLDKNGFECIEVQNNVYRKQNESQNTEIPMGKLNIVDMVNQLRQSEYVDEHKFGNISSFNFSKTAFRHKQWDDTTTKARGLFINTNNYEIVSRSYDKFFNINERENTKIDQLKNVLTFPCYAFIKENGFLGLIGYDLETDSLIISSKACLTGDFSGYFQEIVHSKLNENQLEVIKEYLKETNSTLVFEVIDPINDPHMIEYKKKDIILLDIIKREMEFVRWSYCDLVNFAQQFKLTHKENYYTFLNWQGFYKWYVDVSENDCIVNDKHIEGFVIEDSNGFMTKLKLPYYSFWKHMRGVASEVARKGYIQKTSALNDALSNEFYGWLKMQDKAILKQDIITLRKLFYKDKE